MATSESTAMECWIQGHCSCTARHSSRRSKGAFTPRGGKPARPEDLQRSNHLGGSQTQVQRGDDDPDLEAAVFQQDVVHGERQQRDQEIALGEAHAQQFPGQRRGDAVEIAPGDCAIALCAENGRGLRPGLGPLRHHAMQQMAIGKVPFVIVEGKLRHAHRSTQPCC